MGMGDCGLIMLRAADLSRDVPSHLNDVTLAHNSDTKSSHARLVVLQMNMLHLILVMSTPNMANLAMAVVPRLNSIHHKGDLLLLNSTPLMEARLLSSTPHMEDHHRHILKEATMGHLNRRTDSPATAGRLREDPLLRQTRTRPMVSRNTDNLNTDSHSMGNSSNTEGSNTTSLMETMETPLILGSGR